MTKAFTNFKDGLRAIVSPLRGREVVIRAEQVRLLRENARADFTGAIVASIVLVGGLWADADRYFLIGWIVGFYLFICYDYSLTARLKRAGTDSTKIVALGRYFALASLVAGSFWGVATAYLYDPVNHYREAATIIVASLVGAGSIPARASFMPSMVMFMSACLLPIAVVVMAQSDKTHVAIGVGIIVFWAICLSIGRNYNRQIRRSIALALDNDALVQQLREGTRILEAANRHKSEFLANMSHELRTPLNAIIGFSELLMEGMAGKLDAKQAEYIQDIHSSGHHLLSLINDILDLAKIEAGRMELLLSSFDVPMALENAVTLIRERANRHGLTIELHIDERLGEFVADERKFKQILLNLLSNAIKFTPEGGKVSVNAVFTEGGIEVTVTDTGVGIAAKDHEVIFEEFRQVGTDHKRKRDGTGLGLSLTKKFVEMHGGRIWVESEPSKGSSFTFVLSSGARSSI